jgi:hypothetical protein
MKHYEHRPQLKFGFKISFNTQALVKDRGHMLMIKFDKSGKIGPSDFLFQTILFLQFHNSNMKGAK